MDYRHQQIQDCFFNTCAQHGMTHVSPMPLLATYDNSVYFASATITALKDMLLKNEIPNNGVYLYQPCFRLHNIQDAFYNGNKIKYPGYFNMLGMAVPAKYIVDLQYIIMDIMDKHGIDRSKIKLNTTRQEPLLVQNLQKYYEVEYDTRAEKSYNWTYGMGDDIHGKGMTFYIKQNNGEYKRLGQYIIIYNKDTPIAAEYGFGIEVFLARTHSYQNEYDAFAISPILKSNRLEANFTNTCVFSSVAATYSTGISINNNPSRQYKKIVRYVLKNLLFLKQRNNLSTEQIRSILQDYSNIEFNNDKYVPTIIDELQTEEKIFYVQTERAYDFIKNSRKNHKDEEVIKQKLTALYPLYSQYMHLINQNQKESL